MLSIRRGVLARSLIVTLLLVLWVAIGAVGGPTQGKLSQVQTNDASAFLPSSAESTRAAEASKAFVDTETIPAIVVLTAPDGADVTQAQTHAVGTWAPTVLDRDRPGGGTWAQDVVGKPAVAPSKDGKALLVVYSLDASRAQDLLPDGDRVTVGFVDDVRTSLADDLGATPDAAGHVGLNAWVTGPAGYVADLVTAFGGIDGVLLLVALGAVFLILVLVYRSPLLPVAVLLTAVFALSLAGLVVYHLADAGVLVLNGQSQGILSILVVGASVDYALLLVSRYREELRRHELPADALRVTLRATIGPIGASAGTVIAGVLCLLLSDLASNRSLGPVAAIGIASAFLAAMTLLPALLIVAGKRSRGLFWPRAPRFAGASDAGQDPVTAHGLWGRLARFVGRRARIVWIVTAVVLLGAAAFVPTLRAGGTSQSDVFLTQVDAVSGEKVLAEHFPAGAVQPITIIVDQDESAAVARAVQDVDGVTAVAPYTGAPTGAPAAGDAKPVVRDGKVRLDATTRSAADSQAATEVAADVRTAAHTAAPDALVGGAAAEQLDTNLAGEHDLRVIVPVVLLVIGIILMLLLRSVLAAALLLAANVLSFGAALGVSAVFFNHVFDFAGADPSVPLFAFVFLVALGVDYSIFLMTRVREESLQVGTRDGVVRALAVTGGVITSAGVVLATTFAALGIIPLLFLAQIAFVVAFGVLLDTLVVRSLLVPALVHDVGRRVWWPSALGRSDGAGRSDGISRSDQPPHPE